MTCLSFWFTVDKVVNLSDAYCDIRPTVVRIPKPPGINTYPDHVILQRCTGSCLFTQSTRHCSVTRQDEIIVPVVEIIGEFYYDYNVIMYNHSDCACDCILKRSSCDATRQIWSSDLCRCLCILDKNDCDQKTQIWDKDKCQCKCGLAQKTCKDHNKAWDFENCGCHCRQVFKDKCTSQGKKIDPQNCHCI